MGKNLTYTTAINAMYEGLHARGKKRVEMLTVSLPVDSNKDIDDCFKLLLQRFSRWTNKWGKTTKVSYIKVNVSHTSNKHIHSLVTKPWLTPETLRRMWFEITGIEGAQIMCKTISKDKTDKKQMKRVVQYIADQSERHKDSIVSFSKSDNWDSTSSDRYTKVVTEDQEVLV